MDLQEEYEREKIQWTFIEFPDNKDCIELIDRKPNGIIPTLDEQVMPSPLLFSDSFAARPCSKYHNTRALKDGLFVEEALFSAPIRRNC